jgi:hypothetical protein
MFLTIAHANYLHHDVRIVVIHAATLARKIGATRKQDRLLTITAYLWTIDVKSPTKVLAVTKMRNKTVMPVRRS